MLITKNNYSSILYEQQEQNKALSEKLHHLFESVENGVISIGSVGNSISSGYSKCDEMIPLLCRTELKESEHLKFYSYARVRKNEEVNVLKWYAQNISHQEINKLLIDDILEKIGKYACFGEEQLEIYRKFANSKSIGLKDFVKLDNNIIIYNGLTGTFTDTLRKGNFYDRKKLLSSFASDAKYLQALLMQLYLDNPGCQIYVCGIPDIMGLGITHIFDAYLKKATATIPNAVYINGEARNMLSKLENQQEFDIHYNKPEYLLLLNHIFSVIHDHFFTLPFKGKLLADLAEYSKNIELQDTNAKGDINEINQIIQKYLDIYGSQIGNIEEVLNDVAKYYNENYLAHYPCTNREQVLRSLKKFNN